MLSIKMVSLVLEHYMEKLKLETFLRQHWVIKFFSLLQIWNFASFLMPPEIKEKVTLRR